MSSSTPSAESSDIELLDAIDNGLRNGALMTRANLAFDLLIERLGYKREDIPGYAKDVADIAAADEYWASRMEESTP